MQRNKYLNKKTVIDGITFSSKKEAARYSTLKLLQRAGEISDLVLQPAFELFPKQTRDDGTTERSWNYIADFAYTANGKRVIEDVKGMKTREYIGKRKAMLAIHGITIKEI